MRGKLLYTACQKPFFWHFPHYNNDSYTDLQMQANHAACVMDGPEERVVNCDRGLLREGISRNSYRDVITSIMY